MTKKTEKKFDLVMVVIFIVSILFLGASGYYTLNTTTASIPDNTIKSVQKTISEKNTAQNSEIKVTYPQFSNLPENGNTVNADLEKIPTDLIAEFKKEIAQSLPFQDELSAYGSSLFIEDDIAMANNSFVSVLYSVSNFQPGAAHPNNYNLTYNYSFVTNKSITISDLFIPESDYLAKLSEISSRILTEEDKKQGNDYSFFIEEGVGPKVENFQKFILKPGELVLIFDPYQAGPYVAGTRTVTIPSSELSSVLKPEYSNL